MATISTDTSGVSTYDLNGVKTYANGPNAGQPVGSTTPPPPAGSSSTTQVPRYPTGYTAPTGTTTTSGGTNAVDQAENAYQAATTPQSPADIQAAVEAEYQQQLAAIDSYYQGLKTTQLAAQAKVNASNSGRTRSTDAASGVLGSTFGNSNETTTENANEAANQNIEDTIAAQEDSAKAAVYGNIGAAEESRTTAQTTAYQKSLQDRITYLQGVATQARSQIQTIAATTSLDDLSQEQYDSLYQQAGFDTPEEFNSFYGAARTAAIQGVKLVGDATTGYYLPSVSTDGSVTYKNVIKGQPQIVSGGQYGTYAYDPSTGTISQVSPGQTTKIYSSGGVLYAVNMQTNKATPITSKVGTGADGKIAWGNDLQSTLAVQSWIESGLDSYNQQNGTSYTPDQMLALVKSNPDAFLTALNQAYDSKIYIPSSLTGATGSDTASQNAAAAATDAADQSFNSSNN